MHPTDAVVVSNHDGRHDSTGSTIGALPSIVDAVGSSTEVMFDGGIRSGQDLLRDVTKVSSDIRLRRRDGSFVGQR